MYPNKGYEMELKKQIEALTVLMKSRTGAYEKEGPLSKFMMTHSKTTSTAGSPTPVNRRMSLVLAKHRTDHN